MLPLDEIEIPKDERGLPFFETVADYYRHCLLLKKYREFLNDSGLMYLHVQKSLVFTSFHFLVSDGLTLFITSDNPSFTHVNEDGSKVGLMPITPRILLAQGKKTDKDPTYSVSHITDDAVQKYNSIIESNAVQYIIYDNT